MVKYKEFMEKLKTKSSTLITNNKDDEFVAELEDHEIGNQDSYRLHYVNYHRMGEGYGRSDNNIGVINYPLEGFKLPYGMDREDGFKVLSYLTDFVEEQCDLEPCSLKGVLILNDLLNSKCLGFRRLNVSGDNNVDGIISLYTVSGRLQLFKKSIFYQNYFEWYKEGVTLSEVKDIYSKCGRTFDIEISASADRPKLIKKK